jgi:hypothetical protein
VNGTGKKGIDIGMKYKKGGRVQQPIGNGKE